MNHNKFEILTPLLCVLLIIIIGAYKNKDKLSSSFTNNPAKTIMAIVAGAGSTLILIFVVAVCLALFAEI